MKPLLFLFLGFCFSVCAAQSTFTFTNGRSVHFPGEALCSYQYPSDTTDQLYLKTHIAITPDSILYANALFYKQDVVGLLIVRAAIKDLKRDLNFNIIDVDLDLKKSKKGYVITFNTSVGHNAFFMEQESKELPYYSVTGMQLQMISCSRENADAIVKEVSKRLEAIK